jgi:hypothetical protein
MNKKHKGEKDVHLVFSEGISQCFRSFIADIIIFEIECCYRLSQKPEDINKNHKGEKDVHLVFSEGISQCFRSFSADIIISEIERSECLW